MLGTTLLFSSVLNVVGGLVLMATWLVNAMTDPDRHVPPIVLFIGASLFIQGLYSFGYVRGWWRAWEDVSSGALLAGQLLSGCVGIGGFLISLGYNMKTPMGDFEPAPMLAGLLMAVNAALALVLLVRQGVLRPRA